MVKGIGLYLMWHQPDRYRHLKVLIIPCGDAHSSDNTRHTDQPEAI